MVVVATDLGLFHGGGGFCFIVVLWDTSVVSWVLFLVASHIL
jgi:hypothetical protein